MSQDQWLLPLGRQEVLQLIARDKKALVGHWQTDVGYSRYATPFGNPYKVASFLDGYAQGGSKGGYLYVVHWFPHVSMELYT